MHTDSSGKRKAKELQGSIPDLPSHVFLLTAG